MTEDPWSWPIEAQAPEPRALSERERQVVSYAVQGHSNVRSRTELVRVARLLAQET